MRKLLNSISLLLIITLSSCTSIHYINEKIPDMEADFQDEAKELFNAINLDGKLDFEIFKKALVGHKYIKVDKPDILTIIDYSQPSVNKRCYVIDMKNKSLLYQTLIAHGKNSGENYATQFSNIPQSKQSSLGFFRTSDTYEGSNGYSIMLDGLEKGINDLARLREIVIHGADYVSQKFIEENDRLGRSWGCPALPRDVSDEIINTIKGQSLVYIYSNDAAYLNYSLYIPDNI